MTLQKSLPVRAFPRPLCRVISTTGHGERGKAGGHSLGNRGDWLRAVQTKHTLAHWTERSIGVILPRINSELVRTHRARYFACAG